MPAKAINGVESVKKFFLYIVCNEPSDRLRALDLEIPRL